MGTTQSTHGHTDRPLRGNTAHSTHGHPGRPPYAEHPRRPAHYWTRIGWTSQIDRNFISGAGNPHFDHYFYGIGARIRSARLAAGLAQIDLALAIGCSTSAVFNWEHNRTGVHPDMLARIEDACGSVIDRSDTAA